MVLKNAVNVMEKDILIFIVNIKKKAYMLFNKYYDGTGNTTNKLKNAKIYSSEKYANQAGNKMIKKSSKLTDYNLVEIEIKEIE